MEKSVISILKASKILSNKIIIIIMDVYYKEKVKASAHKS
jgi:hypothetical protein